MKAVLLFDMPKNCMECSQRYEMCPHFVEADSRPKDCILRALPEKRHREEYHYQWERSYDNGWNRVIDRITGDAEKEDAENAWWAAHSSRFD